MKHVMNSHPLPPQTARYETETGTDKVSYTFIFIKQVMNSHPLPPQTAR